MPVFRNAFTEGIKADMYAYSLESYPQLPPVYQQLFEIADSSSAYELSTTAIGPEDLIEKPEGEPISYSRAGEGFTVAARNHTFARGFEVTEENVEDFNSRKIANLVTTMAGKWTESYFRLLETEAAKLFNYGGYTAGHSCFNATVAGYTDNSGDLCYDGKPFFNLSGNTRPLYPGASGSKYNGLALGLDATNLQTAYDLMTVTNNVDARGAKIAIMPDIILLPPGLRWTAMNLLQAAGQVNSANNDINTVKNLLKPIEWQYLTDTNAWFIGTAKKGIKFYNRVRLGFDFWQDSDTGGYKAKARARFGFEVNDFRYWVGSNFSTS